MSDVNNNKCKYYTEKKTCGKADEIAGVENISCHLTEKACDICTNKTYPPQDLNKVTVSLAISGLNRNKDKNSREKVKDLLIEYSYFLSYDSKKPKLEKIITGDGVGSYTWRILDEIGIKHDSSCSCLYWAERMNNWGPEGCRKYKAEIVEHFKNSSKNYGWGELTLAAVKSIQTGLAFKINPLDIYGSLLDEAIRLAELDELDRGKKKLTKKT